MPHTGAEPKPPWQAVPRDVREAVEAALGAGVQRATRAWGGYSPAPTFRLLLTDGRRVFLKAVGPDDNPFSRAAFRREERIYRELADLIGPWAPARLGAIEQDGWQGLLLEDLGPKSAPPWLPATMRGVARTYAAFHRATLGTALPEWAPGPGRYLSRETALWGQLQTSGALPKVATVAGGRTDEALRWLEAAVPALAEAGAALGEVGPPYALLHGDTRSDNLRWRGGRLYLFDWPHAGAGPPEWDLAAFAQTVTVEGGPEPEQIVAWYAEQGTVRDEALTAAVAAVAGFFADAAWQPDVPGLPRLRPFQRAQLRISLAWAARRLRLPAPEWLDALR